MARKKRYSFPRVGDGRRSRIWSGITIFLTLFQIGLGQATNLYVRIAKNHPGSGTNFAKGAYPSIKWALSSTSMPLLQSHIVVGVLLLLASLYTTIVVGDTKDNVAISLSIIGISAVIFSALYGVTFLQAQGNTNAIVMAVGSLVTIATYLALMIRAYGLRRSF
ncbi:MAG: hypothetical protein M0019_01175 [Actinomycetota bacterium]|nr:hypothetical protein [Actinomycetota bacterium]